MFSQGVSFSSESEGMFGYSDERASRRRAAYQEAYAQRQERRSPLRQVLFRDSYYNNSKKLEKKEAPCGFVETNFRKALLKGTVIRRFPRGFIYGSGCPCSQRISRTPVARTNSSGRPSRTQALTYRSLNALSPVMIAVTCVVPST